MAETDYSRQKGNLLWSFLFLTFSLEVNAEKHTFPARVNIY